MITVNNFSAWISIADRPCEEYGVDLSIGNSTVTCWIASEAGKEYEVNWMCNMFYGPTAGRLRIDGNHCGGLLSESPTDVAQMKGIRTSATALERFFFSSVKTTDDSAFLSTAESLELGDIQLIIMNTTPTPTDVYFPQPVPEEKIYHESSKRCISHQTRFLQTTTAETPLAYARDFGVPIAMFCFKYRPLDVLQASGIAPLLSPGHQMFPSPPYSSSSYPQPQAGPSRRPQLKRPRDSGGFEDEEEEEVRGQLGDITGGSEEADLADDAKLRELQSEIQAILARKKARETSRKRIKTEPSM
ncbi:hypothetical protein PM082_022621 [Marasmius tenuissimus]|nr:hypothetical protein PM082_022621 [Marasmius tenuissimus]